MSVPAIPGDRDHPDWWSVHDQRILDGALAELAELPRPPYIERDAHRMVYRPIVVPRRRRWAREIGAWIVLVATLALILLLASWAGERPAAPGAPVVTPTTYGPPGPSGGPR